MRRFTDAVRKCLETENWYGALALALTLPDICGKIEYPNERSVGARYANWYKRYLEPANTGDVVGNQVLFLSGNDCYALRCSYLHTGSDDITEMKAREVLKKFHFTTHRIHRVLVNGEYLTLNVKMFCEEICAGVETWEAERKSDPEVARKIENLLTIKTGGFSAGPGVQFGGQ